MLARWFARAATAPRRSSRGRSRSATRCATLAAAKAVDGCSVVEPSHVAPRARLTYVERAYLNPVTATGPHWDDLLPARVYRVQLDRVPMVVSRAALPSGLPPPSPVAVFEGAQPLVFFHIITTGGESLELHLSRQPSPRVDKSVWREAAGEPARAAR